jgi:hypothetical protein
MHYGDVVLPVDAMNVIRLHRSPLPDVIEVRPVTAEYLARLPGQPFKAVLDRFHARGWMAPEDCRLEVLYPLFDLANVNMYDVSEPENPRIRFTGSGMPLNDSVGFRGKPVREAPAPREYTDLLISHLDTVTLACAPAAHHIFTSYNGHAYHRLLVPVLKDRQVERVVSFFVYPSRYLG